jgi:hypothetical protein
MLDEVRPSALEPSPERSHPRERELERFMHGELTRPEARQIVRHLLLGCPHCIQVTRRLWTLAGRTPPAVETSRGRGRGNLTLVKSIPREPGS